MMQSPCFSLMQTEDEWFRTGTAEENSAGAFSNLLQAPDLTIKTCVLPEVRGENSDTSEMPDFHPHIIAVPYVSSNLQLSEEIGMPGTTKYITLEDAKKAMAAAEAEARKNNWNVAIAILDAGGNLILFEKMDDTQLGSVTIAVGKGRT